MNYIELKLTVNPEFADIFMAELGEIGFETFTEEAYGLNAYITEDLFSEETIDEIMERYLAMTPISYSYTTLEKKNWNEEWEKSYEPISVNGLVRVRASFHEPDNQHRFDIVINPKMSFGTGHHETTSMVLLPSKLANLDISLSLSSGSSALSLSLESRFTLTILSAIAFSTSEGIGKLITNIWSNLCLPLSILISPKPVAWI